MATEEVPCPNSSSGDKLYQVYLLVSLHKMITITCLYTIYINMGGFWQLGLWIASNLHSWWWWHRGLHRLWGCWGWLWCGCFRGCQQQCGLGLVWSSGPHHHCCYLSQFCHLMELACVQPGFSEVGTWRDGCVGLVTGAGLMADFPEKGWF